MTNTKNLAINIKVSEGTREIEWKAGKVSLARESAFTVPGDTILRITRGKGITCNIKYPIRAKKNRII